MKDYSQNGEQQVILDLFADTERGRLLDVGAYDGEVFSHSRALIERGWGGVLAEPEPAAFLKLFELYRGRDDIRLVNACVGEAFYLSRFWHTADMVGTTEERHYDKWQNAATYDGVYYVAVVPFTDLYAAAEPDFVSIDVEGGSARMAIHMLARNQLPRVICVEHDGMADRLVEMGSGRGYREVLRNYENLILAR